MSCEPRPFDNRIAQGTFVRGWTFHMVVQIVACLFVFPPNVLFQSELTEPSFKAPRDDAVQKQIPHAFPVAFVRGTTLGTWLSRRTSNYERDGCALGTWFFRNALFDASVKASVLRGKTQAHEGLCSEPSDLSPNFTDRHFRNNMKARARHFHSMPPFAPPVHAQTLSRNCRTCPRNSHTHSAHRVSVSCELSFSSCLPRVVCTRRSQRHKRHEMRSRAKAARIHIAVVAFAVEWRTVVLDQTRRIP